jgi:hypothetical protein
LLFSLFHPSDRILNFHCRISQDCPDAAILCGYGKCLPVNTVLSIPRYLEISGGFKNTEVLTFAIPCKTKRQAVRRIQYPGVPILRGEENQPAKTDNTAIENLRFLNDVISLPAYADFFAA